MTLYIIALMYCNTKARCTELADCFDEVSHDQFSRLLHKPRPWQKLLWRLVGQGEVLMGGGHRYIGDCEEYLPEEDAPIVEIEKTRIVKIVTEEDDSPAPITAENQTIIRQPVVQDANHKLKLSSALMVIALLAAITLGAMVIVLSGRKTATATNQPPFPIRSLAVLPLRNLSNDSDDEYFADGLTETFISELSKIKSLKVISRSSVFTYKGKEIDPREVGNRLGVEAVLEGSVSKSRDTVQVQTRLVSAEDGRILWVGNTFDRSLKDLFAVQDEISCSLAASLKIAVCGEAGRNPANAIP